MTTSTRRAGRRSVPLLVRWALAIVGVVAGIVLLAVDEGNSADYGWTAYPPLSSIEGAPDYLPAPVLTADLGYLVILVAAMALVGALVLHGVRGALRVDRERPDA